MVNIYKLSDPISGEIRYVGKTHSSLHTRLGGHLTYIGDNIEKNIWIKSLKEKGLRPEINLLEVTSEEFSDIREGEWIQKFTNHGVKLLNKTLDENHKFVILTKYIAELNRRGYAKNTIKNYRSYFICFLRDFTGKIYKSITTEEITSYLSSLVETKKISSVHQNSLINAIKFYYEKVLGFPAKKYYIGRPRKKSKIRPILSTSQVAQLLDSIKNIKHRTVISLIYYAALRINEATNLLVTDVDFKNSAIIIKDPKGGGDRNLPIPAKITKLIEDYLEEYKCDYYLFEGQDSKDPYSATSIRLTFDRHVKMLNFNPELTPHCLRHSRASHVLNNGVKIEMASKYLGHKKITTTSEIYHHYMLDEMRGQFDSADEKISMKS